MIILLIFVGVIGLYILLTYNRFVTMRTRVRASVQEIGNQLKRQANLIPNLEESVKGYLKHEKAIFAELAEARKAILSASSQNNLGEMVKANELLQKTLGNLRVVVESTPQIKGVETVTRLMDELRDTADKVMYSRRNLIDQTADYNIMRSTFPSNLVAQLFHFEEKKGLITPQKGEHLEVEPEEIKTPKVKF
ncbi:MAG TPA: LemA family protein [Patescibacteria group bacterium]|nr:LemA family protein [Patescibacteria group bacterium]